MLQHRVIVEEINLLCTLNLLLKFLNGSWTIKIRVGNRAEKNGRRQILGNLPDNSRHWPCLSVRFHHFIKYNKECRALAAGSGLLYRNTY